MKPRKRSGKYVCCPHCGFDAALTMLGKVRLHKDGRGWCSFHGMKPAQHGVLVKEGLLVSMGKFVKQCFGNKFVPFN